MCIRDRAWALHTEALPMSLSSLELSIDKLHLGVSSPLTTDRRNVRNVERVFATYCKSYFLKAYENKYQANTVNSKKETDL